MGEFAYPNNLDRINLINIDDTKLLLEDESFCNKSGNNIYNNLSSINKRFNNTQLLLDEKTSILIEDSQKNQFEEEKSSDNINQILKQDNSYMNNDYSNNINNNINLSHSLDDILSLSKTNTNNNNNTNNKILPEIEFDLNTIFYGVMFPTESKIVKLKMKNISKIPANIEIKISEKENVKEYFQDFNDICDNSNLKYQNLFQIINNECKLTLNPQQQIEFEIKVAVPLVKKAENLFSLLEIYTNNFLDKTIPLQATIEIPKVCCLKNLQNEKMNKIPLIPIKIEIQSKGQKYRLPFKNYSLKEMSIEFTINKKYNLNDYYYSSLDSKAYKVNILFFPSCLSIPPQSVSYVEMIIKVCLVTNDENNNHISNNNGQQNQRKDKNIRKIVNMKVMNTSLNYSMFIDGFVSEKSD